LRLLDSSLRTDADDRRGNGLVNRIDRLPGTACRRLKEGPAAATRKPQPGSGKAMLVLTRTKDESIYLGDDIIVTIVDIRGDRVRLGIIAPDHVRIHRQEVYEAIQRDRLSNHTPTKDSPTVIDKDGAK
jgi:carbon storage regulator